MSKLITRIKRLALALCLATPIVSWAVTTTGYEDFGDTAGVVLWRGTEANFHASTVIDVAEDGSLGTPYAMTADQSATSWQRFASNQSAYASPGKVLVYDTPGSDQGYKYNPDCTFGPLTFGGMWVKTLAINGLPFSILGSGDRKTEFGAAGKSTLFKFDASYTIDRTGTTTFYGDATVDIAQGATFTAQANSSYGVVVDSAATLKLKGAGTLAVTTMTVNGTLDLSAETVPSISGNVAFAGDATIVVPAGTALNETISLEVCSGTLSAAGVVYVKVGDGEPQEAELTISGGTITEITTGIQTEQTFTSDYPSEVPAGYTYTYEATEAVTIPAVTVNGTLKTSGPITISNFAIASGADFEVVAGNTTVGNGGGTCQLKGNIKIDAGATLTNTKTDTLDYNGSMTVDVYGTLAMGTTRWSVPGGCTFKLRNGAQVTGAGDSLASLDFINGASKGIDVYGSATIEGKIRVRANETRIWVAENSTLVLSSGIADGGGHYAGFKQVGPGTLELHANSTGLSGNASIMTQGTLRLVDTTLAFPVDMQGTSTLSVEATAADTTVPVNATLASGASFTFTGLGKVSGSLTFAAAPTSTVQTFLQNNWTGTATLNYAITGAENGTKFQACLYGNADSTVVLGQGASNIFFADAAGTAPGVGTKLYFKGDVSIKNGYAYNQNTPPPVRSNETVFPELGADEGVTFTMRQDGNRTTFFRINTLKNFAGTIAVPALNDVLIDNVELSELPAKGALVVKATKADAETSVIAGSVTVGEETVQLEYGTVGEQTGLMRPVTVDITITPVDNATASVTVNGAAVTPVEGVITVKVGDVVSVTYTADDGYVVTGSPVEFTASAETTTVDVSGISADVILATITSADGETVTPYTSVATAFTLVDDDETLTLVGAAVTLASNVTVEKSYTLAGDAEGTAVTGAGKIYLTGSAELTIDATLSSVGNQILFSSKDAKLTFPTEGFTPNVRPLSGYQTGTTVNGDGTTTYYQYLFLTLQVGASNVTLAYDGSGDSVVTKQVYEGDELVFTATPAEGYENPVVTVNGNTLTPVDGKYTVVVGTANVVVQATATAIPTYAVTLDDDDEHIELSVSPASPVARGAIVVITVAVDDGYMVDEVVYEGITEEDVVENEDEGTITFTMPDNAVTVTVTSKEKVATYTVNADSDIPNADGSIAVPAGTTTIMLKGKDVTAGFDIDGTTATFKKPNVTTMTFGDGVVTLDVALVDGLAYGVAAEETIEDLKAATPTLRTYDGSDEVKAEILTVKKPSEAVGFIKVCVEFKDRTIVVD